LASKVLDASAFYAGIPFLSQSEYCTTSLVYDEIKHIKKTHDALGVLLQTKRLEIKDPDTQYIESVNKVARKTGDQSNLSKQDISVIALSLELNLGLITDDFAVSNVAKNLKIQIYPLMTSGIQKVGNWIYYCPGCNKSFSELSICPLCGNTLRRKLKTKSTNVKI